MKQILLGIFFFVLSYNLFAQKNEKAANDTYLYVTSGLYASINVTTQSTEFEYPRLLGGGGIPFVRLYMGDFFAIETGVEINRTEKSFGYEKGVLDPSVYIGYSVYNKGLAIPILAQFHLGKRDNRLRPFFSIGGGYSWVTYVVNWTTKDWLGNVVSNGESIMPDNGPFIQISQGITYNFNNRLQLNEYCYYKFLSGFGRREAGLRIGLGYNITH